MSLDNAKCPMGAESVLAEKRRSSCFLGQSPPTSARPTLRSATSSRFAQNFLAISTVTPTFGQPLANWDSWSVCQLPPLPSTGGLPCSSRGGCGRYRPLCPPPPPRPSHQSAPFVPELLPPSTIPFNIACCSLSVPALCPAPHKLVQGGIFAFFTDVSQVSLRVPGTW